MNDYVYGIQRTADRVEIPNVPVSEFCFRIQILWRPIGVDLREQRIQNPDLVSVPQETIHDKRTDEARTARDKNAITTHADVRLSGDSRRGAKNVCDPRHVGRSAVPLLDGDPGLLSHGSS